MRAQCVISYGQIQMTVEDGAFHHVVLATPLDKIFLKHLTMPTVSHWCLELTSL
ncbi:hypothetical protein I79_022822 [Cricetulus griseus]|uniref:Uncharacterized protein n=1 Tax=Cricetulus griseus TaxID=10029 RepID=G3IGD8_CRIGR|nr:hypothetical protein I79_022822 [Cricetulus griseus]